MISHADRRILAAMADGLCCWEIAAALGLTEGGVAQAQQRIYRRLGLVGKRRRERAIWMFFTGEAFEIRRQRR